MELSFPRSERSSGRLKMALTTLLPKILFEFFLLVVVAPAGIFILLLPLGGILAAMERWDFLTGMVYTISIVCGLAQPLGAANNVDPISTVGRFACAVAGLWTLGLTGAIATIAGTFSVSAQLLKRVCRWIVIRCRCASEKGLEQWSYLPFVLSTLLISPLAILLIVAVFAAFLMWIDKAPEFGSTYFYFLADVGGLPNPLVSWIPAPVFSSTFVDVYFSMILYVFSSACLGAAQELLPEDMSGSVRWIGCFFTSLNRLMPAPRQVANEEP